jgi:8-oxo-dGTP pyrophosphatase MutT (NUDIX family)
MFRAIPMCLDPDLTHQPDQTESPVATDEPRFEPDPVLIASLESADLDGAEQEAVRAEMLELAHAEVDSLLRTCEPGHFTGSALIVNADGDRLLVLFHTKAQRWFQPGGHADGQADLSDVALREAEEETGLEGLLVVGPAIDLDIHWLRPVDAPPHRHLDVRYLLRAPADAVVQGNHESEALRWVTLDELRELDPDDGLIRLATRGLDLAAAR